MKYFVRATLVIGLLALSAGCDALLTKPEPSTSVRQEVALSNPEAVRGIRAKMYDRMHDSVGDEAELSTRWLLGPAALADNTFIRPGAGRFEDLNRFEVRDGIGDNAYNDLYQLINDANILISGVEEGTLPEAVRNKLKAEGYFMRALAMHHAVRIWGYDPNGQGGVVSPNSGPGAGFNLGIVIRTEPTLSIEDVKAEPRSTVSEVYAQIVSDLKNAMQLFTQLPGDVREGTVFYPSAAAVQALLARVRLYQRHWAAADSAASAAIQLAGSMFGSRLARPSEVADIFNNTSVSPEEIFTIDTTPQQSAGVNDAIAAYTSVYWMAQIPTQDLIDLYPSGDARLEAWYTPCFDDIGGEKPGGCDQVNAKGLELHKWTAEPNPGQYADDYPHLRIAEMVLIQTEARLHTSGSAAAIAKLNELREARGIGDYSGPTSFEAVYDEILDARRRELVAEGHRFFDLKRLGRDIRKIDADGNVYFIPYNSFQILDDIPPSQLDVNEELVQNLGYN